MVSLNKILRFYQGVFELIMTKRNTLILPAIIFSLAFSEVFSTQSAGASGPQASTTSSSTSQSAQDSAKTQNTTDVKQDDIYEKVESGLGSPIPKPAQESLPNPIKAPIKETQKEPQPKKDSPAESSQKSNAGSDASMEEVAGVAGASRSAAKMIIAAGETGVFKLPTEHKSMAKEISQKEFKGESKGESNNASKENPVANADSAKDAGKEIGKALGGLISQNEKTLTEEVIDYLKKTSHKNLFSINTLISFGTMLLRVLIIVFIYLSVKKLVVRSFKKYQKSIKEQKRRQSTLSHIMPILFNLAKILLAVIAGLLILSELQINISPIVYSFSLIGLAVTFGAQTLIKDLITGFLIIWEGNLAVGDFVAIGNTSGTVEAITLRYVLIRQSNGSLETIPFSELKGWVNRSRDYSSARITFSVPFHLGFTSTVQAIHRAYERITAEDNICGIKATSGIKAIRVISMNHEAMEFVVAIDTELDPKQDFKNYFLYLLAEEIQSL